MGGDVSGKNVGEGRGFGLDKMITANQQHQHQHQQHCSGASSTSAGRALSHASSCSDQDRDDGNPSATASVTHSHRDADVLYFDEFLDHLKCATLSLSPHASRSTTLSGNINNHNARERSVPAQPRNLADRAARSLSASKSRSVPT